MVEDEPGCVGAAHAELVELRFGGESRHRLLDDERLELRAIARFESEPLPSATRA